MALVKLRGHKKQRKVMNRGKWTDVKEGEMIVKGERRKDGNKESKCIAYIYEAVKGLS